YTWLLATTPADPSITSHADLVAHDVARAAEGLLRGGREEVRHARSVEARVVVHLLAEARLLVALLQERAPVRMEPQVDPPLERVELGVDLPELAADALDGALEAHAIGLHLRGRGARSRRAVAGGDGCEITGARAAVVEDARQLLDARLVVAKIVFELLSLLVERLDGGEVLLAGFVGGDLRLELLHDHRRAPGALFLRAQDVAVD